jgi:arylsulfatase A-like enzyme
MQPLLRLLLVGSALLAFGVRAEKPNIVFILFDDLGYGEPGCYRADSPFRTPNLDRMAREGMRFTDAHSASAVCTPTRYGVLTGRYPWRIGQYGVLTTYSPPIIPRSRPTVASLLKDQGYRTACFGKWHLGMTWPAGGKRSDNDSAPIGTRIADGPIALGFDRFAGYTHARNIGMIIEQDAVATNVEPVAVQPLLADRAVAWIEESAKAGGPFFLYLPLCTPHTPIVPASEFRGSNRKDDYAAWISQGDAVVGRMMDAIDRAGLASNTLIIATSDNGAAGRAYPPLRGSKTMIWEGGHRIPFLARWPGQVAARATNTHTVCLNDLFATAAELSDAKVPAAAGEDSFSLVAELRGTAREPARSYTVHQSHGGALGIRQGPWKLVFEGGDKTSLFNLETDLGERDDVAKSHPEIVERMTALLQDSIDRGRSTPGARQDNDVKVMLGKRGKAGKGAKE